MERPHVTGFLRALAKRKHDASDSLEIIQRQLLQQRKKLSLR